MKKLVAAIAMAANVAVLILSLIQLVQLLG